MGEEISAIMQSNHINNRKGYERTNKQKKFLKKPKNKTARKQFFKEILQNGSERRNKTLENFLNFDLETFASILHFADISKELEVEIIGWLLYAPLELGTEADEIEMFFSFSRHNIFALLFQLLIALRAKALSDYKEFQIKLLARILCFFNFYLGLKRFQKLLRNTEGFEIISQPNFWEPIYFSSKFDSFVAVKVLWFSIRISGEKMFAENFIQKYVELARRYNSQVQNSGEGYDFKLTQLEILRSISLTILESEQGEFLLKLVSELPEKNYIIPSESKAEYLKSHSVLGKARALIKCTNCKVLEKSEKQFQKCSRCGFAFYCSRACQKKDWQNHKKICNQN